MGMGFALTLLRQVSPLLHMTSLTTEHKVMVRNRVTISVWFWFYVFYCSYCSELLFPCNITVMCLRCMHPIFSQYVETNWHFLLI